MLIVCGWPARPPLDAPIGAGRLYVREGETVDAFLVPIGGFTLTDLRMNLVRFEGTELLPSRSAEVWFEPMAERSH